MFFPLVCLLIVCAILREPKTATLTLHNITRCCLLLCLFHSQLVLWVRDRLHKQLEEALKKKCFTFLSFHQPETDEEGDVLRAAKVLRLASTLEDEKRRLQNDQEKHQEMRALLEKQQEIYPHVLLRCLSLLRQAASELRLKAQSDIDRINAEYLEAKSNALFLKLRMEELQVLTDCYSPEKVAVHRQIR
ncbi:hypothetical protein XENTR_v10001908 [Xenopus tropicalis]|nr:hypothetical protein XENTR_v10001908 [Xenopus tropicalis]